MLGFLLTEWQFHHADYHNARKRNLALEIISTELQLPFTGISKKDGWAKVLLQSAETKSSVFNKE